MVRFLSAAWLDQLAETAAGLSPPPPDDESERSLTLRQVITGGPDGDVVYDLCLERDHIAVRRSAGGAPDVAFEQDHATARRLARGETHPQVELTEGRLRIAGPASRLRAWRPTLDALDRALADLRAVTTW
jgi:hypothetical protein